MARDFAGALTWANSAGANTPQTLTDPDTSHNPGAAIVHIHNPSAVTALTIQPQLQWTDDASNVRTSNLGATFSVPAGATVATRVEGFGMGIGILRATNATALGATDGFTARARVEWLG